MRPMTADCVEGRTHLTRLPGLADPVLQFDLAKEIAQLRTKESWNLTPDAVRKPWSSNRTFGSFSFDEGQHAHGGAQS